MFSKYILTTNSQKRVVSTANNRLDVDTSTGILSNFRSWKQQHNLPPSIIAKLKRNRHILRCLPRRCGTTTIWLQGWRARSNPIHSIACSMQFVAYVSDVELVHRVWRVIIVLGSARSAAVTKRWIQFESGCARRRSNTVWRRAPPADVRTLM